MAFSPTKMREYRERSGLTQPALAVKIGAKKQQIFNWEIGASTPHANTVEQIADALGVCIDDLYDKDHKGEAA